MRIPLKKCSFFLCALLLAGCACRNPFAAESSVSDSSAAAGGSSASVTDSADILDDSADSAAASAASDAAPTAIPMAEITGQNGPETFDLSSIPPYEEAPAVEVHGNAPYFTEAEIADALALCGDGEATSLIHFSELDESERAGTAIAILSKADMATAERVAIPGIKPSGWHNAKYDWIDGNYVYNRCHLLGYQLTAENGDIRNLITGTRYLNITGMLPYENRAAYYLRRNSTAHILYRVTPVFAGDDLVASGVLMEALSLEDGGAGLSYCVYCYNVQPGVKIDYATGFTEDAMGTDAMGT